MTVGEPGRGMHYAVSTMQIGDCHEPVRQDQSDQRRRDVDAYLELLHDDYVFVRHQTGMEMTKADQPAMRTMMASDALKVETNRCIYENDDILVAHQVMSFPDGTREAVMIVHTVVDGKSRARKQGRHRCPKDALKVEINGGTGRTGATSSLPDHPGVRGLQSGRAACAMGAPV